MSTKHHDWITCVIWMSAAALMAGVSYSEGNYISFGVGCLVAGSMGTLAAYCWMLKEVVPEIKKLEIKSLENQIALRKHLVKELDRGRDDQ